MPTIDFDFQRYVERRKGAHQALAREGAAYAYGGDLRLRQALERLRPVTVALETAERLWRTAARDQLLTGATRVSAKEHERLHAVIERAAAALHVPPPTVYLVDEEALATPMTLGSSEEHLVLLPRPLASALNPAELTFVVGRECGRIQNQAVLPTTARFYLERFAASFVRWIVAPALAALRAWSRRSDFTLDRAGLLCARDLEVAGAALRKVGVAVERLHALELFAASHYYRALVGEEGGTSGEECDARVAELLGGGGGGDGGHDHGGGR